MNKDFQSFIRGLDKKALAEGIKKAQEFSKTAEGRKMIEKIKSGEKIGGIDKEKLQESFKSNPELLKKINDMLE